MPSSGSHHLPATYDGREQAFIKHSLLRTYLQKLVLIMGMSPSSRRAGKVEICYVDCFAGPWEAPSDDLAGTSIAVSLQILAACKQTLASWGVTATMRALFIEKSPASFIRLKTFLEQRAPKGVEAGCIQGDFLHHRQAILDWCGSNAFAFFFIDPKGWKGIGVDELEPLLSRPRSEFLINFMYMFVNRAASMAEQQASMRTLLGADVDLTGLTPDEREAVLLANYRAGLKERVSVPRQPQYVPRTAYARVLDVKKERVKYHLIYLTSHPKGVVEFMLASEKAEEIQRTVRDYVKGAARAELTGMDDMFGDDPAVPVSQARAAAVDIDQFWLSYLAGGFRSVGLTEFADILEQTDWFPGELQASLVSLIDRDLVANLDAARPRPDKPLHYEKADRLQAITPKLVRSD